MQNSEFQVQPSEQLFPLPARAALATVGAAERWAAVQAELHPRLAALAEQVAATARQQMPREWPLYEVSYKAQRYLNRGPGRRDPIDDYWVAFDRPPRGAGVTITVSLPEQAVLVGIQLWGPRKPALAQLWGLARLVWQPLIERIAHAGQARFAERVRSVGPGGRGAAGHDQPAAALSPQRDEPAHDSYAASAVPLAPLWIDRYLGARGASYLWAGFVYPLATQPTDLEARLIDDTIDLLRLNEALMEQAELEQPLAAALRERPERYTAGGIPQIEQLAERIRARGFTIADLTLRAYHVALQTRPLLILPGISGTGKTRLTRLYADAVYQIAPGQDNPYYLLVAVQPDWHSPRDLLGYYHSLTHVFHPTAFLRFLLAAAADPQQTYYVCLDELNLARPEYYLAPLLAAMETAEASFDLGAPLAEVPLLGGGMLRNPLRLPVNLRMIGTVNVDESTFALSDKLLDRANLIELTDVDLPAFRAAYRGPIDPPVWEAISALQPLATLAGHPFGYRTIEEMLRYVEQSNAVLTPTQALDLQIKQKVLPRLRGEDSPRLRRALGELLALTLASPQSQWSRAAHVGPAQLAAAPYPESAAKLQRMLERLDQDGFTDFYG